MSIARPLPILVILAALVSNWKAWRGPLPYRSTQALRLGLALFAGGLLGKIALNVRLMHYGFVLALPATLLAIGFSVHAWPQVLNQSNRVRAGQGRAVMLAFWLVLAGGFQLRSHQQRRQQSASFGSGPDRMQTWPLLADPMQAAQDWLAQRIQAGETLLVMPEGVMLNYQLRVPSPTRFINFMPPELLFWGEDTILAELQAAQPDYVVFVHKDTTEYGVPSFGSHYGRALYAWVRANYQVQATFGATPFSSPAFGVAIYSR